MFAPDIAIDSLQLHDRHFALALPMMVPHRHSDKSAIEVAFIPM
jgi:hypothetical protein